MYPYHHDPEGDAALAAELSRIFDRITSPFKRAWAWLRAEMPPPNENGIYAPPMGFGGIGGYYPAVAMHEHDKPLTARPTMHESCGCEELSQRDRWDMPIMREAVVTGPPISEDLQRVFGYFGKVTGLIVEDDGGIEVVFDSAVRVQYVPVTGARYEGL